MKRTRKLKRELRGNVFRSQIRLETLETRKLLAADLLLGEDAGLEARAADVSELIAPPSARIVNGQLTSDFEGVGIVNGGCSGTLISPTHVLTAAHCTVGSSASEMSFQTDTGTYRVSSFANHPRYDDAAFDVGYDIAILTLSEQVVGVEPYQIFRGTPEVGDSLTLVGFGEGGTSDGNPVYDFGNKRVGETDIDRVTPMHLFWNFDSHSEANTAPGDSGGPAFLLVDGQYQVAGVTSGGSGDAHTLGDESFDTRVDAFASWIDSIVGDTSGDPGGDPGGETGGDPGNGEPGNENPTEDDHADEIGADATVIIMDEFGGLADGHLEESGDVDVFTFDVGADDTYEIYLQSAWDDIDTALTLSDVEGNTIATTTEIGSLADSMLLTELTTGTYYVIVAAAGSNDTGEYYLDILPVGFGFDDGDLPGGGDLPGEGNDPGGDWGVDDPWNDGWQDGNWWESDNWWDEGNAAFGHAQQSCDVNNDNVVTALDALQIINQLNQPAGQRDSQAQLDVTGEGELSALDALLVVNLLNRHTNSASTETRRIGTAAAGDPAVPTIMSSTASWAARRDSAFEADGWL